MTEQMRTASPTGHPGPKMENDLSPRKTMLILVIVVGCFAVLWPKVFYPMLVGSANQHIKPSPIDKTTGCCDVISETDVNTIKIMSELCGTIIKSTEDRPLTGKEIVQKCHQEVLETCGIDISLVLQEQVRLGQNVKQILDEIRSLNGSLCLKYNYGVAPWRLGVPHRAKSAAELPNIRQERPLHLRSELVHPAFRERGRAIPQRQEAPPSRPPPRVMEGRPGPVPGMRPTIGGAGHVVPPSKQGTSNMSVIMPIYTIGIVLFFMYTLLKLVYKKPAENVGGPLYPPVESDPHFRKEVFESEASRLGPRLTRENIASKLVVNAMSALLDEVDQEMEARRKSNEVASQDLANGTLSNGAAVKPQDEEQPTVKVLGMEMTASCEGGKKWSRPESPVLPASPSPPPVEPGPPPQEIFLEGALPAQSHLLVSESATEPEPMSGEDPAVVLSGKMTLSVISLDSENGEEATTGAEDVTKQIEPVTKEETVVEKPLVKLEESEDPVTTIQESTMRLVEELLKEEDFPVVPEQVTFNIEDETEKLLAHLGNESTQSSLLDKDIEVFLQKLKEENDFQAPSITLESDDVAPVEVESLEKEVEYLIQEAIESIQHKEPQATLDETTNEITHDLKLSEADIFPKIEKVSETSQPQTFLQVSNDVLELEKEKSPKLELKEEISSDIEKLLQEVKDLTVAQPKQDNELQIERAESAHEKISIPAETGDSQIKEKLNLETEKLEAAVEEISHKMEELTSSIEDTSKGVSDLQEFEEPVAKKSLEVVAAAPKLPDSASSVEVAPAKVEEKQIIKETELIDLTAARPSADAEAPKPQQGLTVSKTEDSKSRTSESDDEELGSEEEIEEIVYEEESEEEEEEEIEIEVEEEEEESEEELPDDRNATRTASSSVQKVNGERSEDFVEDSKYTTVSGATAAENDISDEELTDNEEEEEEEIIEVDEEMEDEELLDEDGNDINNISGSSDVEL